MNCKATSLSLALFSALGVGAFAQAPAVEFPAPSPAATLKQRVGITDVEIVYSRPSLRGRKIFGELVPFGEVWRTGANAPTRVTFSTDVKLQGAVLAAGAYELYTIPGKDEWTIIVQKLPAGAPPGAFAYKQEKDTARMTAKPATTPTPIESFTMAVTDLRDTSATIYLAWENTRVSLKLEMDTVAILLPKLRAAMSADGPKTWNLYSGAANLLYENGGDLQMALGWVDESIKLRGDYAGTQLLRTRILAKLGRSADAKAAAAKAIETGLKAEGTNSATARQAKAIADSIK